MGDEGSQIRRARGKFIAMAGFTLDRPGTGFHGLENGRLFVGAWVILVALGGLMVSFSIAHNPAAFVRVALVGGFAVLLGIFIWATLRRARWA